MAAYITTAVKMIADGELAAMVTCPISKDALNRAGFNFPGHTEMLAALTASSRYTMMMAGEKLSVTLATIHCAVNDISQQLSVDKILSLIKTTHHALSVDFAVKTPRLGIAGLNPHAGEGGLFGDEEERLIIPAVKLARQQGIDIQGPYPADTIFVRAIKDFAAVDSMYHDQGLIPFKLLHFADGVNITLDLPIVRTSVDHGTAYDIAGKGIASYLSLQRAVEFARLIADNRARYAQS
jgi:4-hydroxythreonine-4-phosphate dehydrogenase